MEIRKNNDVKFQISFVDPAGYAISNIKDVKCTLINSAISKIISPVCNIHSKLMHSVMCGYNHTYNVFPVNYKDYYKPFVYKKMHNGKEELPVFVDPTTGTASSYFSSKKQMVCGKYNMLVELECWDPSWQDGGVHTHTVELLDVIEIKDGVKSVSGQNIVYLNVIVPHSVSPDPEDELVPAVYYGQLQEDREITPQDITTSARLTHKFTVPFPNLYIICPSTQTIAFAKGTQSLLQVSQDGTITGPLKHEVQVKTKQSYLGTDYNIITFEYTSLDEQTVDVLLS